MLSLPIVANSTVIMIDNTDTGFSSVGFIESLYTGTTRPSIGGTYMVDQAGTQGDYAIWDPTNSADWVAGIWQVEMNWTAWSNRASAALLTIGSGLDTLFINQTINGGNWQDLGNYSFGTSGSYVKMDDSNSSRGKYLVADAVRFTLISAEPTIVSAVSAPACIALLGFGAFGLLRLRRSK